MEEMTKAEDEATRKEKEQEEEAKRQAIQEYSKYYTLRRGTMNDERWND